MTRAATLRVAFYTVLCAVAGCAAPRPAERELSRDAKWQADVDCLAHELPRLHKNAFFKCSRESFDSAAAKLRADVPRLADHQIVVGMMRLIALIGDGHTQAQNFAQVGGFRTLPIVAEWLHDGYYVTRTLRRFEAILGAKLVRIGELPVDEAARRLAETFPAENEMQIRRRVPLAMRNPELLHACGLSAGLDRVAFTTADANGKEAIIELSPIASDREWRWVFAAERVPLAEQRAEPYWHQAIVTPSHGPAMYLAYNTCSGFGEFRTLCDAMFTGIPTGDGPDAKKWRLIIDLRRNGGGNSMVIDAMYPHLLWRPALREPGHLLVLIGRGTFSSAMMNAIQLRQRYGAVLIGEPTGGSPNAYGEIKPLTLPHSKLVVMYSTNYFSLVDGDVQTVTPDVLVEPTIADVLAGKDPVLDAALQFVQARPGAETANN
ncbi:Peptidase family S41 [Phycisphaerae bacterium RAS2]|nr:Peptidase family S41 [Phycisphaerae bacterium RAS2]